MNSHDVLLESILLRKGLVTELAGELFPVMFSLPMRLEVVLSAECLPTLRTGVDLCHGRVYVPQVSLKRVIVLEDLAAVRTRGSFEHSRLF